MVIGRVLSIDHTMKTAGKAVIIDSDGKRIKPFTGVFQAIDEDSRILGWVRPFFHG